MGEAQSLSLVVGGVKSQGRVSNNSSVSEGRTRWPLALLLQAETFLFTADFNSLWTPALAWPCSGEKWHPLQLPKNSEIFLLDRSPAVLFALTLVCLKLHILHSQRAFIVCDTFPKILSRFSVRVFYMKYISLRFDQTHHCNDAADESIKEKKDDSGSLFSNINLLKNGA